MDLATITANSYLVGGAVRDELLDLPVSDRDYIVVGCNPQQLLQAGFQQVGKDFPVFLHPATKAEYALARTERKSGSGYTGFICDFGPDITLEEDLSRRDLTINAIAKSADGNYCDPFQGRADLRNRVLKHVSPAFIEDPLRVLRVARFAARFSHLGFTVDPSTMALMSELSHSGELETLTVERVWKETSRALGENTPSVFIRVLRECGALAVLFPEVDRLFGVPQTATHHPEVDTGEHLLLCLDIAKRLFDNDLVTFTVLCHDLGKGITTQAQWPRHIDHENAGVPLVEQLCQRLKVPKEYAAMARLVCLNHLRCHRIPEMKAGSILKLLESLDAFRRPGRVNVFTAACEADARGRLGFENRPYPQKDILNLCLQAANSVDIRALTERGLQGEALVAQIRQVRIEAIKRVK